MNADEVMNAWVIDRLKQRHPDVAEWKDPYILTEEATSYGPYTGDWPGYPLAVSLGAQYASSSRTWPRPCAASPSSPPASGHNKAPPDPRSRAPMETLQRKVFR